LPSASVQAWMFVLMPPWLRPRHSVAAALFLARRVLVGPQDGRIEQHPLQLRGFDRVEAAFPHAFLGEPPKALAPRVRLAKAFGQVGPGATSGHYPQYSIEK